MNGDSSTTSDERLAGEAPRISVRNLSVRLNSQEERQGSLREYLISRMKGCKPTGREIWPLVEISFEIEPFETFAVIGRNGAGKTTLLKVIAGIVPPTRGEVVVRGRMAPLLELGAGFEPELTGRENVQLYGSLLGFRNRYLASRVIEIARFAELEAYLDIPLKNYSAGMIARLAFAIATDAKPEILLVDEVLSVGDAKFQQKCRERIEEFRSSGTSIILVTHDLELVHGLSRRALLLEKGRQVALGPAREVTCAYTADPHSEPG